MNSKFTKQQNEVPQSELDAIFAQGEPMTKQATSNTEDFTLTPREYIGTIQYWNGPYEIDAREYELLQYSGHKITLYPPFNPQPLAQGPVMLGIDTYHEK